jgi:uncharacterized membrane protein
MKGAGIMEYFFLLLLAGFVASAWSRIGTLERRVAELADALEALRFVRGADMAEPRREAPPLPVTSAVPAQPKAPAVDAGDETIAEPLPEPVTPAAEAPDTATETPPEDPDEAPAQRGLSFDFEDIFGRRLPIWGGGFALAIAGIFLVRFSIEAGLLTPPVRVAMSFVFGLALLAGAETAYRFDARLADPRVRQALAGAGLATLYGAFYLAGTTYGLIGAGAAFVGLASVTAAAIALSFRFGLPSAVIGLVGGFAAPLLVDSDSANVPLLSFYLALITGGLAWSGEAQGRRWLSYAALAAGLGWGVLMMVAGVASTSDFAALGLYLLVLGAVLPAFLHSRGGPSLPQLAAGGIATLQMAVLVDDAGFAPLTWGLYLLIGGALAGLGWRFAALRPGTLVAAGLGLWLLVIWPDPETRFFAAVAAGQVAIFAGVPLAHHWRGRAGLLDLGQLAAVSFIMAIAVYARFGRWDADIFEPLLAASTAALAVLPAAAFVLLWRRGQEGETRQVLTVLGPAATLAFGALLLVSPAWLAPAMALAATAPLLWCEARRAASAPHAAAWAGAATTALALAVTPGFAAEFTQLGDLAEPVDTLRAVLRWAAAMAPFAALAIIARPAPSRATGEALAVALGYGLVAQVVPSAALAWLEATAAIGLFLALPQRIAAWTTALAIAAAWSLVPLAGWGLGGLLALAGEPFMVTSAVAPLDLALRVAPFLAVLAVLLAKGQALRGDVRAGVLLGLGLVATIALHSLYKQVFAITSTFQFEHYGMGERSIWQALLVAAAYGAGQSLPQALRRPVSLGLAGAALAHFAVFTLVLHNPLLSVQHVGPTPIANWLTLAYLGAMAALWIGQEQWHDAPPAARTACNAVRMALIALLTFSLLRQVFAGSVLTASAIGQTESLLISLLGILLALGYLWWGSWRASRSWRIGSLVLMLVAVIKVFLIDAAGLEGLLRIASFMALGFSLIGIGWVYTRQLARSAPR